MKPLQAFLIVAVRSGLFGRPLAGAVGKDGGGRCP